MANYIKTLQEENRQLKAKLQAKDLAPKDDYDDLSDEEDGRQRVIEIVYRNMGRNGQNESPIVSEKLPLKEAFNKLVAFYGAFGKPTDRNVPKDYWNGQKPVVCNNTVCYVKKTFVDLMSGQKIENLRKEVPLWLAVDDAIQKGQDVRLISKKEYDDFYRGEVRKEIRAQKAFREKQLELERDKMLAEIEAEKSEIKNG